MQTLLRASCSVFVFLGVVQGQVIRELGPTRVLRVASLFADAADGSVQIDQVSMKGANWAALITLGGDSGGGKRWPSAVAYGNAREERSARVPVGTRAAWSSLEGDVYLEVSDYRDSRRMLKLLEVGEKSIAAANATFEIAKSLEAADDDPDKGVMQRRWTFGGAGGDAYVLGGVSERLLKVDSRGRVSSITTIDLDAVYAHLGKQVAKHAIGSGRSRILWAEFTAQEDLLLGLADLSINAPACVVGLSTRDGVVRNIYLLHAPTDRRNVDRFNVYGSAFLSTGSGDQNLVLADQKSGLLVFYALP